MKYFVLKNALAKYLANAKFSLCYFFPEPKVAFGKDPLYYVKFFNSISINLAILSFMSRS